MRCPPRAAAAAAAARAHPRRSPRRSLRRRYGSHWMVHFVQAMRTVFAWLREHFDGVLVYRGLYESRTRTCPSGYDPERRTLPLGPPVFGSESYAELDRHVHGVVAALGMANRTHFVHVRNAMYERCDRFDPLHFAHPGPTNDWADYLYNLLLSREAAADEGGADGGASGAAGSGAAARRHVRRLAKAKAARAAAVRRRRRSPAEKRRLLRLAGSTTTSTTTREGRVSQSSLV